MSLHFLMQETVWTELQHYAEATEGKSALSLMLVELLKHEVIIRMLYVEMICIYIYVYIYIYYLYICMFTIIYRPVCMVYVFKVYADIL